MNRASASHALHSHRMLLVAVGLVAAILLLLIGFRGTTPDGLAWVELSLTRARALHAGDLSALLARDGIFFADLLATLVAAVIPDHAPRALHGLGIACGALSTTLVAALGLRAGGPRSALIAAALALCTMPWLGLFGTLNPMAPLITLTLAFLWLWTTPNLHPLGAALAAALLAALGLSWIGAFALVILLVAAELLGDRDPRGGIILRLDHMLILFFGLALFVAFPGFWPDPTSTIPEVFLDPLLATGPDLVFRGHTYPPARPPLSLGLMGWLEASAPVVLVVALGGIALARPWRTLMSQRLTRALVALLLATVLLPWLARGPAAWGVEMSALALAALMVLSAPGVVAALDALRHHPDRHIQKARLILPAILIASALLPILTGPPDAFETTRYALPGRVLTGPDAHNAPARSALLPVDFLKRAHAQHGPLDPAEFRQLTDLYVAMGALNAETLEPADKSTSLPRLIALPQLGAGPTWRAVGAGSAWRPGTLATTEGGGLYGLLLPAPADDKRLAP